MKRNSARNFFLHCDECHHEVDFDGKMGRQHIGILCPMCNADMLTEADYKVGRRIQALHTVLIFLRLMRPAKRGDVPGPGEALMRHHFHHGRSHISITRGER